MEKIVTAPETRAPQARASGTAPPSFFGSWFLGYNHEIPRP